MHPIERLRYVARSDGAPAELLVHESAAALVAFSHQPAALVAASRRILDRQLSCGPLWWLCSRMLCAIEPYDEAVAVLDEFGRFDVASALGEHAAGAAISIEAFAVGDEQALVPSGTAELVEFAASESMPVVLVAGPGCVLPSTLFASLLRRWHDQPPRRGERPGAAPPEELVDLETIGELVGPVQPGAATWPVAAELLRLDG